MEPADHNELERMAADRSHPVRIWVRAPLIDCTLSFIVVVAFSAVFVASGTIILGPEHQIPDEKNMLTLQAKFVTGIHPILYPLYVAGAFLTMFGTLYGTFEVAHTIFNEIVRCFRPDIVKNHARRLKLINVAWCALGAYLVLGWSLAHQLSGAKEQPRILLAILTPVNLFTGVLGCGLFCFVVVWMERRFLPSGLRMPIALTALNIFAGVAFFFLGVKGYWDVDGRTVAVGGLAGVALLSLIIAAAWPRKTQDDSEDESFA